MCMFFKHGMRTVYFAYKCLITPGRTDKTPFQAYTLRCTESESS